MVVGLEAEACGSASERVQRAVELGPRSQLGSGEAGVAEVDAGIDFDHRALARGRLDAVALDEVEGPDRHPSVEPVKEPHSGEAGLGDLSGADRVVGARRLAPAQSIEPGIALAEVHEMRLHAVGDPEIEMAAVALLEEGRGAEILVAAMALDIGPEGARIGGHSVP